VYGAPIPVDIIVNGSTYARTFGSSTSWHSDSIKLNLGTNSTIQFLSNGLPFDLDYFELALLTSDAPLPVKFVYFNAKCNSSAVDLQWKTAQEQSANSFSIQRSVDGSNWTEIGRVAAAGQSSQERSYAFVDRTPTGSANFYRVVEYDYSGQQLISSIIKSSCSVKNEISLYPNPSSVNSTLSITLGRSANVTVQILDGKGALVHQKQLQLPSGNSTIGLDVSKYAKGVYTVKVSYDSDVKTIKMIKK
jgi:hypothetical protein